MRSPQIKLINAGTAAQLGWMCHLLILSVCAVCAISLVPTSTAQTVKPASTAKSAAITSSNIAGVWWIQNFDPQLRPSNGSAIPFTAKGQSQYQSNLAEIQSGKLVDLATKNCLPEGLPRTMAAAYPMQIVQSATHVTLIHEVNHTFTSIVMNGKHPSEDDLDPTFMGHSIGHWEGDTLVVDSVGFRSKNWIDATGVPHSEQLHVTQRIRKLNDKQLEVVITIEDPVTFTQAWSVRRTYEARPDVKIQEFPCGEPHRYLPGLNAKAYYYQSGAAAKGVPKDAAMAYFAQMAAVQSSAPSQPTTKPGAKSTPTATPVPAPDFSGKWNRDRRVKGDKGPFYSPETADLSFYQPWVETEIRRRMAAVKAGSQVPLNNIQCMLDGMPFLMQEAHPMMIRQTSDELIFIFEADHQLRYVHLNAQHPANLLPSYFGHSIGHWDGDTLVIDTVGLNDKSQLDFDGGPHSEALHLTERMRFSEGTQRIEIKTTVEDPIVLKAPRIYTLNFARDQKESALTNEYVCAENNRDAH